MPVGACETWRQTGEGHSLGGEIEKDQRREDNDIQQVHAHSHTHTQCCQCTGCRGAGLRERAEFLHHQRCRSKPPAAGSLRLMLKTTHFYPLKLLHVLSRNRDASTLRRDYLRLEEKTRGGERVGSVGERRETEVGGEGGEDEEMGTPTLALRRMSLKWKCSAECALIHEMKGTVSTHTRTQNTPTFS